MSPSYDRYTLRASAAATAVTTEYGTAYEDAKKTSTATATTSNKLTDSAGVFTTATTYGLIAIGDIVKNTTNGKFALVTAIDSATALSLSADIMANTNGYVIYTNHGYQIPIVASELVAILDLTAAATDVGDTLDVYLDTSFDAGLTFVNVVHFTQILGNGGAKRYIAALKANPIAASNVVLATTDQAAGNALQMGFGDRFRYRSTLVDGNGNASFTYSLKIIEKE